MAPEMGYTVLGGLTASPASMPRVCTIITIRKGTVAVIAARRGSRMIQPAMRAATKPANGVMATSGMSVGAGQPRSFDAQNLRDALLCGRPAYERPSRAAGTA